MPHFGGNSCSSIDVGLTVRREPCENWMIDKSCRGFMEWKTTYFTYTLWIFSNHQHIQRIWIITQKGKRSANEYCVLFFFLCSIGYKRWGAFLAVECGTISFIICHFSPMLSNSATILFEGRDIQQYEIIMYENQYVIFSTIMALTYSLIIKSDDVSFLFVLCYRNKKIMKLFLFR